MTEQWICPLICEYPIHCLRPPQIAGGHLTSALKAKQPCSWKTHLFRALLCVALHWIAVTMHQGWGRNHKEPARCLAHTGPRFLPRTTPLCLRKKGEKKKHLAMTTSKSLHTRSLPSDGWDSRRPLDESDPFFGGPRPDLRLAISPPTCGMHEYRPRRALIPDPRATRGRHALKQEVDEIKRTNQIAVPRD